MSINSEYAALVKRVENMDAIEAEEAGLLFVNGGESACVRILAEQALERVNEEFSKFCKLFGGEKRLWQLHGDLGRYYLTATDKTTLSCFNNLRSRRDDCRGVAAKAIAAAQKASADD